MRDHVDERFSKIIITSAPVGMFEIFQRILNNIIQGYKLMKRFLRFRVGKILTPRDSPKSFFWIQSKMESAGENIQC